MSPYDGFDPPTPEEEGEESAPWETEGDLPFLEDGWPEHLAGPEYWLYRKQDGGEEG